MPPPRQKSRRPAAPAHAQRPRSTASPSSQQKPARRRDRPDSRQNEQGLRLWFSPCTWLRLLPGTLKGVLVTRYPRTPAVRLRTARCWRWRRTSTTEQELHLLARYRARKG